VVIEDWAGRFERYVARKEAEARTAAIDPLTTAIDRGDDRFVAIRSQWSDSLFDGPFYVSPPRRPELPSTSLVFVQSRDGNTGAKNPAALGGGEADKHLIYEGLSRVAADAVLAGAETVRGGNLVLSTWHPELVAIRASLGLPRHPIQVVATLRGITFDGLIFNAPELRVILVTVPACTDLMMNELTDRPWIAPVVMASPRDLVRAFRALRTLGIRTMSCIGGRTLAGHLLDAGLIQDLYLTTSATEGGEPNTPMYSKPLEAELVLRKHGTGRDADVVFEMFSVSGRS